MSRTEDPDILIHPRRGKKEKSIPKSGILLVNPAEARNAHLIYKKTDGESRFLFNSNLSVAGDRSSFVAGPSIGAPMAVMTMEKLIALGASRIILFGWCGAASKVLSVGDVLIPDLALSGEGTSHYYNQKTKIEPSLKLNQVLEEFLLGKDIGFKNGCVWSTDAIYREDRRLIKKLSSEKSVSAVDMEFSALCAVAKFRGIQFSAMLMVSDELWGKTWKPGFASTNFKKQCKHMLGLLFEHVSKNEIS